MNRLWLIGGALVLVAAAVFSWLMASRQAEVDQLLVLAEATQAGCDAPGELWLTIGNGGDRPVLSADGVISIARSADEMPFAVGNFHFDGPLLPGMQKQVCAPIVEPQLGTVDRQRVWWLARATAAEFGEAAGNALNPADQGFLRGAPR